MKVLLTVRSEDDPQSFKNAMLGELQALVDRGEVERAALDVRATGEELDALKVLDTDPDVTGGGSSIVSSLTIAVAGEPLHPARSSSNPARSHLRIAHPPSVRAHWGVSANPSEWVYNLCL